MIVLGAFVGAFCASFVADHYSRRMSIRVGVIFFLIGSAIQTGKWERNEVFLFSLLILPTFIVLFFFPRLFHIWNLGSRKTGRGFGCGIPVNDVPSLH
jgi:MFS family permease